MAKIKVTKFSGEQETYDESKLRKSLQRAGATADMIDEITGTLESELYDGISTHEIYKNAHRQLKKLSKRAEGRYKIKEAIMELGPSGYPFEKLTGEILKRFGYSIRTGIIIAGKCISHEVDVIAENENTVFIVECKFYNSKDKKCDIRNPLYFQSRYLDVAENWTNLHGNHNKKLQGWLVTNTRFTSDSIQYGNCSGLKLLSWDYPKENSLRELIAHAGLYPITTIPSLSKNDKKRLLEMNVVLCNELFENEKLLHEANIAPGKISRVLKEAEAICNHQHQD